MHADPDDLFRGVYIFFLSRRFLRAEHGLLECLIPYGDCTFVGINIVKIYGDLALWALLVTLRHPRLLSPYLVAGISPEYGTSGQVGRGRLAALVSWNSQLPRGVCGSLHPLSHFRHRTLWMHSVLQVHAHSSHRLRGAGFGVDEGGDGGVVAQLVQAAAAAGPDAADRDAQPGADLGVGQRR